MYRKIKIRIVVGALLISAGIGLQIRAQSNPTGIINPPTPVNPFTPVPITPITSTAAAGGATTLTIPAPTQSGYYNYVCYLAMQGSNTSTAATVAVATGSSTNFNGWANKLSVPSAAANDTGVLTYINTSPPGCPKSASPTTSTTFVSPNSAQESYTWYATYFQAP